MFSAALEKATSLFDRRFLINAFFPSFIFCGLSVVVAIRKAELYTPLRGQVLGSVRRSYNLTAFSMWPPNFS